MSRVLLCGAFGQGNPGDEALLEAFVRALDRHDVVATSAGPVPAPARAVAPTAVAVAAELRRSDAVVVGGGTLFKTLHPATRRPADALLVRTALLLGAARARRAPMALVGVGAGELRSRRSRHLAVQIAKRADLLVLRDEESASVLADAGAPRPFRIGADIAWTILDTDRIAGHPRAESVLVSLSHLADRDERRLVDQLVTLCDRLASLGLGVVLQPWQDGPDAADTRLAHAAARARPDLEIAPAPVTLHDAQAEAGRHRAAVALRFHGLVAAAAAGTPTLAVAHEPKLAGLARRLGQPSVPARTSTPVLRRAVDDLLVASAPDAEAVRAQVRAADHSLRLLRLLLSSGDDGELVDRAALDLSAGVPW